MRLVVLPAMAVMEPAMWLPTLPVSVQGALHTRANMKYGQAHLAGRSLPGVPGIQGSMKSRVALPRDRRWWRERRLQDAARR
jgi:hypothetical protein